MEQIKSDKLILSEYYNYNIILMLINSCLILMLMVSWIYFVSFNKKIIKDIYNRLEKLEKL